MRALRIAAGADALTRVLWGDAYFVGAVQLLDGSGAPVSTHDVPVNTDGFVRRPEAAIERGALSSTPTRSRPS